MSTYTPPALAVGPNFYTSDLDLGTQDTSTVANLNIRNGGSLFIGGTGIAQLRSTNIDTSVQSLSITGSNGITASVATNISYVTSGGAVTYTASNTTSGQITLTSAGLQGANGSIYLNATNATSGQVKLVAAGNVASAVSLAATGGTTATFDINSTGALNLQSSNTTSGVNIGTVTSGVPVSIGTANSIVTINGELLAPGGLTRINTTQLNVKDNFFVINSGGSTLGLDTGMSFKKFQNPNDTGSGDVVTGRVQESGTVGTGSTTTAVVLGGTASSTDNFYNGWWIKIATSNAVRRIKSYVGSTKTATIYATADNSNTATSYFTDGLDFSSAPTSTTAYTLYSDPQNTKFFNGTLNAMIESSIAQDAENGAITTAASQQYVPNVAGSYTAQPLKFDNQPMTASGTTVTVTTPGGVLKATVGRLVNISNTTGLSPAPSGNYTIASVSGNTITFTAASATTPSGTPKGTIIFLETSAIYADYILPNSLTSPVVSGLNIFTTTVTIAQTSTTPVSLSPAVGTTGNFFITIQDQTIGGAYYQGTRVKNTATLTNGQVGGQETRMKGSNNQIVEPYWNTSTALQVRHQPAYAGGSGNYIYNVVIYYNYNIF